MNHRPIIVALCVCVCVVTSGFTANGTTAPKIGFDNRGCADLAIGKSEALAG